MEEEENASVGTPEKIEKQSNQEESPKFDEPDAKIDESSPKVDEEIEQLPEQSPESMNNTQSPANEFPVEEKAEIKSNRSLEEPKSESPATDEQDQIQLSVEKPQLDQSLEQQIKNLTSQSEEKDLRIKELESDLRRFRELLEIKETEIQNLKQGSVPKDKEVEEIKHNKPVSVKKNHDLPKKRPELPSADLEFWQIGKSETMGNDIDSLSSIKHLWITSLEKKANSRGNFKQNALTKSTNHSRLLHMKKSSQSSFKRL